MSAAMSFLSDIEKSRGKPWELYPKGNIAEAMCMRKEIWDEKFINGFN